MRHGFFTTTVQLLFALIFLILVWKVSWGFYDRHQAEKRKAAIEIFLSKNLTPEAYVNYILVRDGVRKNGD